MVYFVYTIGRRELGAMPMVVHGGHGVRADTELSLAAVGMLRLSFCAAETS